MGLSIRSDGESLQPADRRLDTFDKQVEHVTREISALLIGKNRRYGNSALEPLRVFSKSDTVEQLNVRIDDKLSRVARGTGREDEDVELDLIGYLILKRIQQRFHSC